MSQSGLNASTVIRNTVVLNVPIIQMPCCARVRDAAEPIAGKGNAWITMLLEQNVSRDVWGMITEKAAMTTIVSIVE